MKKTATLFLASLLIMFFINCENHSEDDLITPPISTPTPIPTPTAKTYNADVKPIFTNSCISCHGKPPSNGAPSSFDVYTLVKDGVENGAILSRMNNNISPMPPSGKLPASTIAIIEQWATDGYLEN
ncbi:MAG: hypothetical protein HRT69_02790 [Flavobacteriaceae bacterium]|nr:hypothetical protein [Flavobacteriaceae bacterium]